uniref:uncharacterized protein n=1 Tax=Lonchura striata TaxID=40157 RepID=UPI000B4CA81C|nr:uncharacterized protein LOC110470286 [Lonchura striata domestica]
MAAPAPLSPAPRRGRTPSAGSAPGRPRAGAAPAARQRPQPMRGRGGEDGEGRGGVRPPPLRAPGGRGDQGNLAAGASPAGIAPPPHGRAEGAAAIPRAGLALAMVPGGALLRGSRRRFPPVPVPVRSPSGGGLRAAAGAGGTGAVLLQARWPHRETKRRASARPDTRTRPSASGGSEFPGTKSHGGRHPCSHDVCAEGNVPPVLPVNGSIGAVVPTAGDPTQQQQRQVSSRLA